MRKAFNTSIDEEILEKFKEKCKEENPPINVVLEKFMQGYIANAFTLKMEYFSNGKQKECSGQPEKLIATLNQLEPKSQSLHILSNFLDLFKSNFPRQISAP